LHSGVSVINGFASTVPWPASSAQPPIIAGLSKHPYPRHLTFPSDDQSSGKCLGADAATTRFVPRYTTFFPEYYATAIQTETVIRDMGPSPNDIYGTAHGRDARRVDGKIAPVPVWITEVGVNPSEVGIADARAAMTLKAKAAARFLLFYLNKGAKRVYLYSAFGGAGEYGLVPDAEADAADADMPGSGLALVRRIVAVMAENSVADDSDRRTLRFSVTPNPASALQFAGGASPDAPAVRNIDMLALLPFQGGPDHFIVAYYFVTRDIRVAAASESVTIAIAGIGKPVSSLRTYDPATDRWNAATADAAGEDRIRTILAVTDTPRLLLVRT
jgi:hypothetical protein